jgi:Raf kinase inhibitor-like YbhB/YbcL family protein
MAHIPSRTTCLLIAVFIIFCARGQRGAEPPAGGSGSFRLTSTAFEPGSVIPRQFTCNGPDVSPSLKWTEPPAGTKSLALIVEDPDAPAGIWVHWVLFNLPADARELPQGMPKDEELAGGARHGRNDFRRLGYGGPCPPPGPAHRYFFRLYALDVKLELKSGAAKADLETAMKGHVLAKAELIGRYGR